MSYLETGRLAMENIHHQLQPDFSFNGFLRLFYRDCSVSANSPSAGGSNGPSYVTLKRDMFHTSLDMPT